MKICHINLAKNYSGGERQTELLIRELAGRGRSQRLIARKDSELVKFVGDVERLEIFQTSNNFLAVGRATAGCSLTHAHEARAAYGCLYGNWFNNIPSVITRRVVRPQKKSWFRDRAYRSAGAVAAVSGAVATHIRDTYPDIEPAVVADATSDLVADASAKTALRDKYAGKVLIVHVGTYNDSHKGQLTIIDAAKRAAVDEPTWQFLLLGEGRDRALFEQSIVDLKNIELTGFVDNVGDYLAAADVFVFPSRHEALGSSLLDAMQFGLPIVATRVGGIPEFVEDGVNGTLIDPAAADQLFDGIAAYANKSPTVSAMHHANRNQADKYSASRMADSYEAIYEKVLNRQAALPQANLRRTPSP